jgi:hypothetical protein
MSLPLVCSSDWLNPTIVYRFSVTSQVCHDLQPLYSHFLFVTLLLLNLLTATKNPTKESKPHRKFQQVLKPVFYELSVYKWSILLDDPKGHHHLYSIDLVPFGITNTSFQICYYTPTSEHRISNC